jgi:hypothetical protein
MDLLLNLSDMFQIPLRRWCSCGKVGVEGLWAGALYMWFSELPLPSSIRPTFSSVLVGEYVSVRTCPLSGRAGAFTSASSRLKLTKSAFAVLPGVRTRH